jgi:pyruvate carboxylase
VIRYYDSLLVKVTARGRDLSMPASAWTAPARVPRSRRQDQHSVPGEMVNPPAPFRAGHDHGSSTTRRRCCGSRRGADRATKLLTYLADVIVNGNPLKWPASRAWRAFAKRPSRSFPT